MNRILFLALVSTLTFSTLVRADDDSPGYDAAVRELKADLRNSEPPPPRIDKTLHIEAGAAFVGSYVDASAGGAMLTGFDIHAGTEIYTPEWLAEISLRSFNSSRASGSASLSMDEYDAKIVHQNDLQKTVALRIGGGLSEQFLKTTDNGGSHTSQATAFLAMVGLDKMFTPKFSLGPDVSYRMPLVGGADQKASLDASLRANFHF